jgi:decaprenylphospho-beta-D-ribofuranose 2-oxidase
MRSFNRIVAFDQVAGQIEVEAGITIGDLNNFLVSAGWILPVLPGYPLITVGGCAAFNVHGKSQYKIGTFGDWVEGLTLYHPGKGEISCSASEKLDIFNLTIGGMGLTGVILTVRLRLKKLSGNQLTIETVNAKNLAHAVELMQEHAENYDYVYSWNNFNLSGGSFGKGIVYLEKITTSSAAAPQPKPFHNRLQISRWPCLWNRLTIPLMCKVYYSMNRLKSPGKPVDLAGASFPIYGKEIYYNFFGKKGFREYQVIFPFAEWEKAGEALRRLIRQEKIPVTLGSLKLFRGITHNLSFSGEGVCVAIDVANTKKSLAFLEKLDAITLQHKGVVNLSKDSRISRDMAMKVFTHYDNFQKRLRNYDPERVFCSDLSNRLGI